MPHMRLERACASRSCATIVTALDTRRASAPRSTIVASAATPDTLRVFADGGASATFAASLKRYASTPRHTILGTVDT